MTQFLNYLIAGLLTGGLYGLLALPLSLVWRTTGVFDFAVGGYVVAAGIVAADIGGVGGAVVGIVVSVALAVVSMLFFLLFKRVQGDKADTLGIGLATFGLLFAITAGMLICFGTEPRFLNVLGGAWHVGGITLTRARVVAFGIAAALLVVTVAVLQRTSLGLRMRASSVAAENAELLGVPVRRVQSGSFVVGGLLAGIVGVLAVATVGLTYDSTTNFSILALSAAVLLGLRGPGTAFLGGLTLGAFESLSSGYIGDTIAGIMPSILILVVLASGISNRGTALAARP